MRRGDADEPLKREGTSDYEINILEDVLVGLGNAAKVVLAPHEE
jgi:hypothetical protein